MRLKSLTLKGFKSFPKPTKLRFPGGICAIVGPNGCGKSNVVDAIRWVLGEQSARLLRAKSMTDLIFSGANGSGPGIAEVRLTIRNNGQFFPPELSKEPEIEILRRVNKDGEGEYRLNGKPCRLKDIHYLFMDTGAGTRAYSIIDQGQVGTFVEMDAGERRRLVEEVAGISRYKSRKIEARNKIVKTQENLDRTEDLLSELKSQLRRLSRQASQARRFLKLREEEDSLKASLLAWSWQQNLEKKKEIEGRLASLQEELSLLQVKLDKADLDSRKAVLSITSLEEDLARSKLAVQERQARLEELLNQKAKLDAGLQRDKSRLDSALKILDESQRGQQALYETKERLESEISVLEDTLLQHVKKEQLLQRGLEEAREARDEVKVALEEVKSELVDLAARYARSNSELQNSEDKIFELESRLERKTRGMATVEADLEAKRNELAEISQELEATSKDIGTAEAQKKRCEEEKLRLEGLIKGLNQEIHDKELAAASLDARIKGLEEMEERQASTADKRDSRGIRTIGIVADFIEVDGGYEHLVEAVLGDLVKAPVLDGADFEQELEKCVQAKVPGRFVIAAREGRGPGSAKLYSTLAEKVRVKPQIAGLVYDKLACWQIVENLAEALRSLGSDSSPKGVILISGEMITCDGEIVLPGSGVKDPAKSTLVRRSELKKLRKERAELEGALKKLYGQSKGFAEELAEQTQLLERLNSKLKGLYGSKVGLERQQEKKIFEQQALEERLGLIQFELDEAELERQSLMERLGELKERVKQDETLKKETEASLAGREEALKNQEGVFERHREALRQHQLEKVRMESDLSNKKSELSRIIKRIQGVVFKKEQVEAEVKGLKQSVKDLSTGVEELAKKLEIQRSLVAEAQKKVEEKEDDISSLREKSDELAMKRRELERLKGKIQQDLNQATIEHEKAIQEMAYLANSAQEQLNIDLASRFEELFKEDSEPIEVEKRLSEVKMKLSRIGAVNLTAVEEYEEVEERYKFIEEQRQDLLDSITSLQNAIKKIDRTCKERFEEALDKVNQKLKVVFPMLFAGGGAELALTDARDPLESGVEYLVRLPGKRIKNLALLSGGEKAMAALALIFAIYLTKPSPFCFLDEVDAPLDEANTLRFNELVRQISSHSQVILITHNQRVMEAADTLYGVTMEEKGISKLVSVNLIEN